MRQLAAGLGILLAVALASPESQAQEADTLDWRRYYPLAVGNVWEYHGAEVRDERTRYTIVADTIANGRTYYRRQIDLALVHSPGTGVDTLRTTRYDYVRYDGGGVVSLSSVASDARELAMCSEHGFERDLRAAFDARAACPSPAQSGADSVWVEGTYATRWSPSGVDGQGQAEPVEVAAVKTFTVGVIFSTFVADVGPVATGNLWGPRLHYARVGGTEYGTPSVLLSGGRQPNGDRPLVRVLGNPVEREARFALDGRPTRDARWTVTDARGRTVQTARLASSSPGAIVRIPTVGLAPGVYHFTLDADGERASVAFTVVR